MVKGVECARGRALRCTVLQLPGAWCLLHPAQFAPLVHAQRLVMLDHTAHLPLCLRVHRTMGRMRKGSIGMPKAKKKKVVRFEEPQEVEVDEAGDRDPTPSSPPPHLPPSEREAAPRSPGAADVSGLRAEKRKAVQAEAEAYRLHAAARSACELRERLMDAQMRKVSRAMKQKGYSDAYWSPRLSKAEERWWVARLKAAEQLRDVAVCTARRLGVELALERAKIRSIRRRLRRRHVFGLMRWL